MKLQVIFSLILMASSMVHALGGKTEGEIETQPSKDRIESVRLTLLPVSPVRSIKDYWHTVKTSPRPAPPLYKPVSIPQYDFEICRTADQKRVALLAMPDSFDENCHQFTSSALRQIGNIPDGEYIVRFVDKDEPRSNTARLIIDSKFDPAVEPTLSLIALPLEPNEKLPLIGIRAVGPELQDAEFTNKSIAFPKLIVDGIKRNLTQILWTGPVAPLEPGRVYIKILRLNDYVPAIEPEKRHTVKAIAGKYESALVVIPADGAFTLQLDPTVKTIKTISEPKRILQGGITGPDGKPANGYEVHLFGKKAERHTEFSNKDGEYNFFNIPAGEYKVVCNPKGKGQPAITLEQIVFDPNKSMVQDFTMKLDISLERKYNFTGTVSYEDGKPVDGMDVALTCEDQQAKAEFIDFTTTDVNGRYKLGGPFGHVSYIGINGGRINGEMPELKLGVTKLNYVLKKNKQGKYVGFPAVQQAETSAVQVEGDFHVTRQKFLRLLTLPEPQLRHAREAIRLFEDKQDWPSLATAYEVAAETMWRVTHMSPEAFIRSATEPASAVIERGGPYVMVQTNLDGEWVKGKGEQPNWIDWIQRKQKDLALERITILKELGALCLDRLNDPPRAVLAYEATGRGIPVCTEPLETLIPKIWPMLKVESNEVLAMDQAGAAYIRLEPLQRLAEAQIAAGNLRGAADTRLRAMLTALIGDHGDWNAHGSTQEAEAFWQVVRRLPPNQPLPPTLWLHVLDPQNSEITVAAPENGPHGLPYSHLGPRFVVRPGCIARKLTVAADMETPGGNGGVRCFTMIKGKVHEIGWVQWHRDSRKGREWRQDTFDLPEDVGIIRLEITPFGGADFHVRNLRVEATFAASGVLTSGAAMQPAPQSTEGEEAWGKAVEGVSVRLHSPEVRWQWLAQNRGQWELLFKTDLKSQTERLLPHYGAPLDEFFAEVDGRWYKRVESFPDVRSVGPSPATLRKNEHTYIVAKHWQSMPEFTLGRHTIRIGLPLSPMSDPNDLWSIAVSNPVEIEIGGAEKTNVENDNTPSLRPGGEREGEIDTSTVQSHEIEPQWIISSPEGISATVKEIKHATGSIFYEKFTEDYLLGLVSQCLEQEITKKIGHTGGEGSSPSEVHKRIGFGIPFPYKDAERFKKIVSFKRTWNKLINQDVYQTFGVYVSGGGEQLIYRTNDRVGTIILDLSPDESEEDVLQVKVMIQEVITPGGTPIVQSSENNPSLRPGGEREGEEGWGEAVEGLRLGLFCTSGERPYRIGGTVRYEVILENTTNQEIILEHLSPSSIKWGSDIKDSKISLVRNEWSIGTGIAVSEKMTIAPRSGWHVGTIEYAIMPQDFNRDSTMPNLQLEPGKYLVSTGLAFSNISSDETWAGRVRSGELELNVVNGEPGWEKDGKVSGVHKGMEFLAGIPEFCDLHLGMTESEFQRHIKQYTLHIKCTEEKDRTTYHLLAESGENIFVSFNDKGECGGIQRMMPIPEAFMAETVAEYVVNRKEVTLPDVEDEAVALDLETGELIEISCQSEIDFNNPDFIQALQNLEYGDLVYENHGFVCLPGVSIQGKPYYEDGVPFPWYKIPKELPFSCVVKTNEGHTYNLNVLETTSNEGCKVRYQLAQDTENVSLRPGGEREVEIEALEEKGVKYRENGMISAAIDCFEKAIDASESADVAKKQLGEIYADEGEYETALKYFSMFLEIHPNDKTVNNKVDSLKRDLEYAELVPWGETHNGLQIRLIIPKNEIEKLPRLSPDNYGARLEVRNVSNKSIQLATYNTTGGRRTMVYDWLIGLTIIGVRQPQNGAVEFFRADDQDGYWSRILNAPSSKEIKPGEKGVFRIQLRRLVDHEGTNLLSLYSQCQLRPVLWVRDDKFGLWHGHAVGSPVHVNIKSVTLRPGGEREGEGEEISLFESYFPEDQEAGKELTEWWNNRSNQHPDNDAFFDLFRKGIRTCTIKFRGNSPMQYLGGNYIWHKQPNDPRAVDIIYHASFSPEFKYYSVYSGLSVADPKSERVLKRLVDIAMEPHQLGRIAWGVNQSKQKEQFIALLDPYLKSSDAEIRERAEIVEKALKGEIDAGKWEREYHQKQKAQKTVEQFGDDLPRIKKTLLTGTSNERLEALEFIKKNNITLYQDKTFIAALGESAKDKNADVRANTSLLLGSNFIWGKTIHPDEAVEILLKLAKDEDREVRIKTVYYGLSNLSNMSEAVVKQLVEMALDPTNDFSRIRWGLAQYADKEITKKHINPYLNLKGEKGELARRLYKEIFNEDPVATEQSENKNVSLRPGGEREGKEEVEKSEASRIRVAGKLFDKKTGKGIEGSRIHFVGAPNDDAKTDSGGLFSTRSDRGRFLQMSLEPKNHSPIYIRMSPGIDEMVASNLQIHIDPNMFYNPQRYLRDEYGDGIFCDGVHCVICDTIKRTKKESYSRIRIAGKYLDKRTGKVIEGAKIHFVGAPDDDAYTYPDGSFAAYAGRGVLHQTYLGSHNIRIQRNIDEALAANLQVHIDPENPPKKYELRDDNGDGVFCDGIDCTICGGNNNNETSGDKSKNKNVSLRPGGEREGEIETQSSVSSPQLSEWKELTLPDVEDKAVALDLETGELIEIPCESEIDFNNPDFIQALQNRENGDLVYENHGFVCLPGVSMNSKPYFEDGVPFPWYKISKDLPFSCIFTTDEGHTYNLNVLEMIRKEGCKIRYQLAQDDNNISLHPDAKAEWVVENDSGKSGNVGQPQIAIEAKVFTAKVTHAEVAEHLKASGVEVKLNPQGLLSFTALTNAQSSAFEKWMASLAGTSALVCPKVRVFDGEKTRMALNDTQKFTTGYEGDTPKVDEFTTGVTFEFTPTYQKQDDAIRLTLAFDKKMILDVMKQTDDAGRETEMPGFGTKSVHTTIAIPQGKTMLVPVAGIGVMVGTKSPAPKTEQIFLLIKTELQQKP